jgi:hypothetical protein
MSGQRVAFCTIFIFPSGGVETLGRDVVEIILISAMFFC